MISVMEDGIPEEVSVERLREAVARPLDDRREVYDAFRPVDVATGETRPRVPPQEGTIRRAAVLVPVLMEVSGPELVYTVRKAHLADHAGQISFPGGGTEATDGSLLATALREAEEEIDLSPDLVEVIGDLEDMYIPPSNFLVKPFVGLLPPEAELALSPDEVEEVFSVPLRTLLSPETFQMVIRKRDGRVYRVPIFAVGGDPTHEIWGATAAITAALLTRLGWPLH